MTVSKGDRTWNTETHFFEQWGLRNRHSSFGEGLIQVIRSPPDHSADFWSFKMSEGPRLGSSNLVYTNDMSNATCEWDYLQWLSSPRAQRAGLKGLRTAFLAEKHYWAERKNGRFSVFPARIRSLVILGHFFDGPDDPTKFCWQRSKIKGTY